MNLINNNNTHNLDFNSDILSENIKVCIRIRPLNMTEQGRGDEKCIEFLNNTNLKFKNKNSNRNYSYNIIFNENSSQEDVFYTCSVNVSHIVNYW